MPKRTLALKSRPAAPRPGIPRGRPGEPAPLSFGQQQLWLHSQMDPDAPLYTESLTIRRRGPLDPQRLADCFDRIVQRHAIWRTTLAWQDGELVQLVRGDHAPRLRYTDLRAASSHEREALALRIAADDLGRPFDLFREPGVRARLVTLAESDHRLYLCLHHLVFDGISIYGVFLPELAALYGGRPGEPPAGIVEAPLQYGDFARWQRATSDEAGAHRSIAYWRRQLDGASPIIDLPTDRPRPARQSFRGGLLRTDLPAPLTASARSVAAAEGCTLFMLLLASFAITLHRWSHQSDLLIGTVSGGRDRPELEHVIGYFLRTLVVRADLRGDPTFGELLRRVRETLLEGLCHDGVPFQRLVRELGPARAPGRSPLFQVTFSIEPPLPPLRPEWDISEMDAGATASKFDLSLELEDRGDSIHVRAIYSLDLFEAATIGRLLADWVRVLEAAVPDPGRRLQDLARIDAPLALA